METFVLLLFAAALLLCVIANLPLLIALVAGYIIFFSYGIYKKKTADELLRMSLSGIVTVKNVLILFIMIGMLTALWRMAGTIPAIVTYSSGFVKPSVMVLMAFLLNCLVSFLTGTAFGTSATMGVICMTIAVSMNMNPVFVGGAILSGVFFGDRCSPVSTSALLVAELTGTDIFKNIRLMMRTCLVPFLATCLVYIVLGQLTETAAYVDGGVGELFARQFKLGFLPLIPALLILVLSAFRVKVKMTMFLSILTAFVLSLLYQNRGIADILYAMVMGFQSSDPDVAAMLNGGGIRSMLNVTAIVCLSSCYAGIFEGTGLLDKLKIRMKAQSEKTSAYGCILGTSAAASLIACNQSLAIMLTHQVCNGLEKDNQKFAIILENTVVVVAALVPWSIACAVPLTSVSAPLTSVFAACYLYFLPLWNYYVTVRQSRSMRKAA